MQLLNFLMLLIIGILLGIGNLWFAAVRSTIPMGIQDCVSRVEKKKEKHPGKDDVYLVHFQSGKVTHVDEAVAKQLRDGSVVEKRPWERELKIRADQEVTAIKLEWSNDFWGMVYAMPIVMVVLLATGIANRKFANESQ